MNRKTFFAMLARDAHVARRNFIPLLLQNMLQPMLFVFIFGRVMTRGGQLFLRVGGAAVLHESKAEISSADQQSKPGCLHRSLA